MSITRRAWVKLAATGSAAVVAGITACGSDPSHNAASSAATARLDDEDYVTLYDTYAMALYYDGTLGPKTGIVTVDQVIADAALDNEFWHGHGGRNHRFTVTSDHLRKMRNLEKVTITTTSVDDHAHTLFVDMNDSRWRVPGAQPVRVRRSPTPAPEI